MVRFYGQAPSPDYRTTYSYNVQGQNTSLLSERMVNGSFQPSYRSFLAYNAQGQLQSVEDQYMDDATGQFTPSGRSLYTYNAAGQIVTQQDQYYSNGAYVNSMLATAAYNGPQNRLSLLTAQRNQTSPAQNYATYTYTYDADGNLAQQLNEYWNDAQQAYLSRFRFFYTYQRTALATKPSVLNAGLSVAPNPAGHSGATTLHYTLPVAATTGATVLDLTGRPVATVPATVQAAGPHTLALPTAPLAAGLYMVKLTAGTQSQQVKLMVE